jgi:hypothetical protein
MSWATVRNEGESYLYSYLRGGTGTTGEYSPVLPVQKNPTVTVNLLETLRENSLPVLPVFHQYHRSTTGTTGSTVFLRRHVLREKGLPVLPDFHRYHRSMAGTTDQPPILPLEQKLAKLRR